MRKTLSGLLVLAMLVLACGGSVPTATAPAATVALPTATSGQPPEATTTAAPQGTVPGQLPTTAPTQPQPTLAATVAVTNTPAATATPAELSTRQIYERLRNSTVRVVATIRETALEYETVGAGTGFVYDLKNGYIVTNAHVIEGAKTVNVATDNSNAMRPARVIGRAECDDIAVLQVTNTRGLTEAPIGDSARLTPGDKVVALGYPRSLDVGGIALGVTGGEVSVLNQELDIYEDLVRHDAAINPGNSGGPLTNGRGEVIGINSAYAIDAQALNFAISIDYARPIIAQLQRRQNLDYTGLNLVPNEYEDTFGTDAGMVVAAVESGSPATRAGIQPEDLLLEVEGTAVEDRVTVCDALRSRKTGDAVRVQVLRSKTDQVLEGELYVGVAPPNAPRLQPADDGTPEPTETPEPALTATLEPEPTATPGDGDDDLEEVVYTKFDDNKPGPWPVGKTESYTLRVADGQYVVDVGKNGNVYSVPTGATNLTDAVVVAEVVPEGDGYAGVVARLKVLPGGDADMYMCFVNNDKEAGCLKRVKKEWTVLVPTKKLAAIKPNGTNILVLAMAENRLLFKVNDVEAVRTTDNALKAGRFGIYAESTPGDFTASYNEIAVFKSKEQ